MEGSTGLTDSQYMSRAIDYIVATDGTDTICEALHDIPKEAEVCARDCQNLDRICVLRFLKYYKGKNH